ncbi:CcdB family protein [Methylobacter sp.]|uniref:CcdB family protein n=1 Tax=Methylobacter sp. TaxID=2051955 RepID=UPI001201A7AE|nr:CcdB family protein [Methylobacter sp.]TAK62247.1 MAG: plasmid maintenance protein CcdB [Methylobacter sp.]
MAQFDVYENNNPKSKKLFPFLLDVQNDLLSNLATTVVIPMCLASETKSMEMPGLIPSLAINGEHYLLLTPQLAGIYRKELGNALTDLSSYRDDIIAALDFLITGI